MGLSFGLKSEQQNLSAPVSWSKPQYPGGFVVLKSEKNGFHCPIHYFQLVNKI